MTRAGLLTLNGADNLSTTFITSDTEDSSCRPNYQESNFKRAEKDFLQDGMLVNIGEGHSRNMAIGESFELKGYRQSQIVGDFATSAIIEPDFNFNIISGESIKVEKTSCNSAKIVATKAGVSVVEVSYDALMLLSGGKEYLYGASEKAQNAVVVFNVGGEDCDITMTDLNGKNINAEMDTIFFENNNSSFSVLSDADYAELCDADFANNAECNGKKVNKDGAGFTFVLREGCNIVKLVRGGDTRYVVLRTKEVTTAVSFDTQSEQNAHLQVGDILSISFSGLSAAIQKAVALYNPCYKASFGGIDNPLTKVIYNANGVDYASEYVSQYGIISHNTIKIVITEQMMASGQIALSGGRISYGWWGENVGAHRNIASGGMQDNINANSHAQEFGYLPNITIKLA